MDKYKRFYGIILFVAVVAVLFYGAYTLISRPMTDLTNYKNTYSAKLQERQAAQNKLEIVNNKLKKIKDSIAGSQKTIYTPLEADLGKDSLFFTLYSDMIEMVHSNSVKIKAISHTPNPASDPFVEFGKDAYFVTDIDMKLVSDYTSLGKLIQDIYQYRYYIKISKMEVKPHARDKKILITDLSLRMYSRTEPAPEAE